MLVLALVLHSQPMPCDIFALFGDDVQADSEPNFLIVEKCFCQSTVSLVLSFSDSSSGVQQNSKLSSDCQQLCECALKGFLLHFDTER